MTQQEALELNLVVLYNKPPNNQDISLNLAIKNGVSFCYCAYFLRISG